MYHLSGNTVTGKSIKASPLDFPRKLSNACSNFATGGGTHCVSPGSSETIAREHQDDESSSTSTSLFDHQPTEERRLSRSTSTSKARRWTQVVALLPVYLLQLCYGMNAAFPAIMTPQLREGCSEFPITEDQESWIVSIDNVPTPIVCILSGFLQQKFGPLKVLLFACFPYTLAWITASLATSVDFLYMSRFLVGVSHGLLTTTIYTVEIASRDMRGTYSMLESVLRCVGSLLIYSLGYAFRWREIAIFAPMVPLLALIVGMLGPESPVYLVARKRLGEARKSLGRLYGPRYRVDDEVGIIQDNLRQIKLNRKHKSTYVKDIQGHPEVYKPFLIILMLSTVQQFSGMSVLRAYIVKIFNRVFTSDAVPSDYAIHHLNNTSMENHLNCTDGGSDAIVSSEAYISAIILGLVRLVSSLLLSNLLRRFRRRSMYFLSAASTIISLISFATCNLLLYQHHQHQLSLDAAQGPDS